MRMKQIIMDSVRLVTPVRYGFLELAHADELPLAETVVSAEKDELSLALWGNTPAPWHHISLVSIQQYRLPGGQSEFDRLRTHFAEDRKKRARLPDGVPYDLATTLALHDVPAGWEHDGFACSSRDFIHLYTSKNRALLIRFLGKKGTILDNPLLSAVAANLRIVPKQWITAFPETEPDPNAEPAIRELPLGEEVKAELISATARAREQLGLKPREKPIVVIEAIGQAVDEMRNRKRVSADSKQEAAIEFGALWGDALVAAKKWQWCALEQNGHTFYAVASPKRSHAVDPMSFVLKLLASKRADNTVILLFNMIVGNNMPESPANGFCMLG